MDKSKMLTAYCMKTKEKNVPMYKAVINKTARGTFMAKGEDENGNRMSAIVGKDKAMQAIADGVATKDFED